MYGEKNFLYMKKTTEAVKAWGDKCAREGLRRPYDAKVGDFPCRSFNLGEQTVTFPHTDMENLTQGWCSITSIGKFDPTKGGHLVLWDFGQIIEFPPGSTILIPSALLIHSNTSIQPGETRYSIVQYAAGGLFRWVENGCMTDGSWLSQASAEDIIRRQSAQAQRWDKAPGMFTHLDELLNEEGGAAEEEMLQVRRRVARKTLANLVSRSKRFHALHTSLSGSYAFLPFGCINTGCMEDHPKLYSISHYLRI